MDRSTAKEARAVLNEAFAHITGWEVEARNGTYDDCEVVFKVALRPVGTKSASQANAEKFAELMGMNMANGRGMQIVGYNTKARSYPWIVTKPDGKRYKLSDQHMIQYGFKKEVDA